MESTSSGSPKAALAKLVQALPYDILKLILDVIFDPSLIGGRPLEADHLDLTDGSDNYLAGSVSIDVADRRFQRSRVIRDTVLFPAPRNFNCYAWLSPGLKLGCAIRIYRRDGLIEFEKILRKQNDIGSYVTILLYYAGPYWRDGCGDDTEAVLRRVLGMTLKKLPYLRALYLQGQAVDAVLGIGNLPLLLPRLKTLYLRDSYGRVPHLLNMPSRMTTLKLKGVQIQTSPPLLSTCPELPELERLGLGSHSSNLPPNLVSYTAYRHLQALSIDTFESEDVQMLLEEVGSQILEICADLREREDGGTVKMPSWFFNHLPHLKRCVVYGHCTPDIIRWIPDTIQGFSWLIGNDKYLKEAVQIFECLQEVGTMPNLQAMPYIGYSEPNFFNDVMEPEISIDQNAIIEAGQAALAHLQNKRSLQELKAHTYATSYRSFWTVLDEWSELAIELPADAPPDLDLFF